VHTLKRYTNPAGEGVHFDIENFSGGTDLYGTDIPRADVPMRIGFEGVDPLGGKSAHIVPYTRPDGQHGFDPPGASLDKAIARCLDGCTESGADPCGCSTTQVFDVGYFVLNLVGQYFQSGAQLLSADACLSTNDCSFIAPLPAPRDPATLE